MADKEKIIIELDFDVSDFTKSAAELNGKISELNKNQRELKKAGKEGSLEFQKNSEALRENKKELAETNKAIQNLTTANKANAGSNEQLKAQLSLLTSEYNLMSKEQRVGTERGRALEKQTKAITDELKGNEEAVGNNKRSVGDYGKALAGTPFGGFISGLRAMGAAALANPLLLVITLIVGAFMLLKKAFTSSEEGQNKLGKATAVISTIFSKLLDVLSPIANFIFDVLGEAFDYIGDKIEEAARGFADTLAFFGFDTAAEGVRSYTDELKKTSEAAARIADQRAKADIIERELIVERAKSEASLSDAKLKSKDIENVSAEDRKKALEEAKILVEKLAAKEEERAQLLFDSLVEENSLTKSNKEAKKAQAEAEAVLFNIQRKRADDLRSLSKDELRINNEIKKANEDRRKAFQDGQKKAIDLNKQQLELLIAQSGTNKKTLQEELDLAEKVAAEKIKILDKELKAKLINQTQYQTQLIAINQTVLTAQTQIAVDNAERELKAIVDLNTSKIENGQFLNDTLFQQELDRQNNILEAQKDFELARLEQGVISQTEFNDAIAEVDRVAAENRATLEAEKKAADDETAQADLANKMDLEILSANNDFERRQIELDRQKAQEIATANKIGSDTFLINKKFAKLQKQLDANVMNAKLQIASETFANLSVLAGKESAAGKAFAIAQTTIDTYKSATSAFSAMSGIPIVGPILGAIAAAAAIASGVRNVSKIASTPTPTAAKGGVFGGEAHSNGGTKGYFSDGTQIEVEKGELFAVVNKRNTAMLNSLNALNTFGGNGKSFFAQGGMKSFADGGVALSSVSGSVEQSQKQLNDFVNIISSIPNPIVVVQDINEVQSNVNKVEVNATI